VLRARPRRVPHRADREADTGTDAVAADDDRKVELVRRSFAALGARDLDALGEIYVPDVDWRPLTGTRVESDGYRGHGGVAAYFEEIEPIWDQVAPHGESYHVHGDQVIVIGSCHIRGHGSGIETQSPMAWVITVQEDRIVAHHAFATAEEALEHAGVASSR
jgi:ketosteroid isomerase-like protein